MPHLHLETAALSSGMGFPSLVPFCFGFQDGKSSRLMKLGHRKYPIRYFNTPPYIDSVISSPNETPVTNTDPELTLTPLILKVDCQLCAR